MFLTLAEQLSVKDTEPSLQEALLLSLSKRQSYNPSTDGNWPPEVTATIYDQDQIGWKPCLEGVPAKRWQVVQQANYTRIGSSKTGRSWLKAILKHGINGSIVTRYCIVSTNKDNDVLSTCCRMKLPMNSFMAGLVYAAAISIV